MSLIPHWNVKGLTGINVIEVIDVVMFGDCPGTDPVGITDAR